MCPPGYHHNGIMAARELGHEKVIDSYKPSVPSTPPPPPLPNFPVPSSYKNGNCLNIPTSLDNLDNIHPRK